MPGSGGPPPSLARAQGGAHTVLPELDALVMAHRAIESVAAGVDMGRNIFQSEAPEAMIRAVGAVVHESMKPGDAFDQYLRQPRVR